MKYYCVFNTNVIIAYFTSKNKKSAINKLIVDNFLNKNNIVPVLNKDILNEYYKVLKRKKFDNSINRKSALSFLDYINNKSISVEDPNDYIKLLEDSVKNGLKDKSDFVFYNVVMEIKEQKENAYLITGNEKGFPKKPFILNAHDMVDIIENNENNELYNKLYDKYYKNIYKNNNFAKELMNKQLSNKNINEKINILGNELKKYDNDFNLQKFKNSLFKYN